MEQTMTAAAFKKLLEEGRAPFILDLRNSDEFRSWRIEGRGRVETLNIPQEDFVGEETRHLAKLPKDRQIVTFCAHGDAAAYSADLLRERGFNVLALAGGMDAWSEYYEHRQVAAGPAIYQISRVAKGCLSYLIAADGKAVVIDAPRHRDRLRELAGTLGVAITHVLDTHLHADHVSGGRELARNAEARYHVHPLDVAGASYGYTPLRDGERIGEGAAAVEVVHSPGHTPGSTSFLLGGRFLFTGDIIMKESIGRPDLGGQAKPWARELYDTLFTRFARFGDDVIVLPAHSTGIREEDGEGIVKLTLGRARAGSDLYQLRDFDAFLARVIVGLPENPARYQDIRKVNLGVLAVDEAKLKELEIGKNLCGMQKG
ncbi:MAG: MBL fold metallo-hydrolase [Nitrospiraceae bacterium]|nr:MBL fold metallo-hydrolase [Nitrospiraceae bacterium]